MPVKLLQGRRMHDFMELKQWYYRKRFPLDTCTRLPWVRYKLVELRWDLVGRLALQL